MNNHWFGAVVTLAIFLMLGMMFWAVATSEVSPQFLRLTVEMVREYPDELLWDLRLALEDGKLTHWEYSGIADKHKQIETKKFIRETEKEFHCRMVEIK